MQYYRTDSTTSRIEALLDRVAATQDGASSELKSAAPNTSTDSTDSFLNPPTLEQFLEEEGMFPPFPLSLSVTSFLDFRF